MASAQVKTAVLLASLYADGQSVVIEPGPSRDHSERMLAYLGAPLTVTGRSTVVDTRGWDRRLACDGFEVPADPSSAAFLVAAALLAGAGEVRLPGVCITRRAPASSMRSPRWWSRRDRGSPRGRSRDDRGSRDPRPARELRGITIAGDLAVRSIDELPILAVLAARARARPWCATPRSCGSRSPTASRRRARCCARSASHARRGPMGSSSRAPRSSVRSGQGARRRRSPDRDGGRDRRLVASGPTHIDDADNVATSYPGFALALTELGATIAQVS